MAEVRRRAVDVETGIAPAPMRALPRDEHEAELAAERSPQGGVMCLDDTATVRDQATHEAVPAGPQAAGGEAGRVGGGVPPV